jgi:hypothetical protein
MTTDTSSCNTAPSGQQLVILAKYKQNTITYYHFNPTLFYRFYGENVLDAAEQLQKFIR